MRSFAVISEVTITGSCTADCARAVAKLMDDQSFWTQDCLGEYLVAKEERPTHINPSVDLRWWQQAYEGGGETKALVFVACCEQANSREEIHARILERLRKTLLGEGLAVSIDGQMNPRETATELDPFVFPAYRITQETLEEFIRNGCADVTEVVRERELQSRLRDLQTGRVYWESWKEGSVALAFRQGETDSWMIGLAGDYKHPRPSEDPFFLWILGGTEEDNRISRLLTACDVPFGFGVVRENGEFRRVRPGETAETVAWPEGHEVALKDFRRFNRTPNLTPTFVEGPWGRSTVGTFVWTDGDPIGSAMARAIGLLGFQGYLDRLPWRTSDHPATGLLRNAGDLERMNDGTYAVLRKDGGLAKVPREILPG